MSEGDWLAERFEEHRTRLRAVAYRMLGSLSEADDAVQETWLRLSHSGGDVENLPAWLRTVVARVCLDMLRSRRARREEPLDERLPDPILSRLDGIDPERESLLAYCVGLALLVVLDALAPAERLAFVLHDVFGVSFDEIAPIVGRTPTAARQLASRARRRVQGASHAGDGDLARQRTVVEAFLAATRAGDFQALLSVLDPDVVLRADTGAGLRVSHGATRVAQGATAASQLAPLGRLVLVNGAPGVVVFNPDGSPRSIADFTVRKGRIVEINVLADPERLRRLELPELD